MDKQELIEQNAAIRKSMADTSTLLDCAYGSSGERLELRVARLIKVEAQARKDRDEARDMLIAMYEGGEPLPSSIFRKAREWSEALHPPRPDPIPCEYCGMVHEAHVNSLCTH